MLKDLLRKVTGRDDGPAQPLVQDGRLVAAAINAHPGGMALAALTPDQAAGAAIVAGIKGLKPGIPMLVKALADDGLTGKCAAWALGRLGAEDELRAAIPEGKLDVRDNGYQALAVLAACGKASPGLAGWLETQVQAEIARAKGGGSGLGEKACRVLGILGAPATDGLAQQVIDQDRFCDRFELQRIRKAVSEGGRDAATAKELSGDWTVVFADQLWQEPAPKAEPAPAPAPAPGPAPKGARTAPPPPPAAADDGMGDEGAEDPAAAGQITPIDWKAFLASPEAAALPPQIKQVAGQLCPLLEQLAARAVGASLTDLSSQEFAGLLLQVLPQALPPQHVQVALSPQALHGYQAMAKYLSRTGLAQGDELLNGIKLVRTQLKEQLRRTGMLGGPDYSDPDEPKLAK